jgi:hypothetical protein
LTEQEMLRFKLAAINMRTHRAKLVRERIRDLIGMATGAGGGNTGAVQPTSSAVVPVEGPLTQGIASTGIPVEGTLTQWTTLATGPVTV